MNPLKMITEEFYQASILFVQVAKALLARLYEKMVDAPADRRQLNALELAFENSDLPFRLDVSDWHRISEEFQQGISADRELFCQRYNSDPPHPL